MKVDPTPFEPFMPASVRALIADARRRRGPAVEWLKGNSPGWGQTGTSFALLRHHPVELPREQLGWLVGMGMFGDDLNVIPRIMRKDNPDVAPVALVAIAAGLRAGVPTMKRQWKAIEQLVEIARSVPDELAAVLPVGLASDQAIARGAALRIAQKVGKRAQQVVADARAETDGKGRKRLDDALAALGGSSTAAPARSKTDDLFARVMAAYERTYDPALVPAITALGAREAQRRGPLAAKSKGELEGAWLALAAKKDPGDIDRLLGTPWPGAWKAAKARVEALQAFPTDPRIAVAIPKIETQYPSQGSWPFHDAAHTLVHRHRRAKRADAPRALLAEANAGQQAVDIDALWRSFREDPSDDGRRLVLADALQTIGDPRGEFIALSIAIAAGTADAAARKRAAKLLDANIDAWTGPLPGVVRSSRVFENGFLSGVQLKTKAAALLASVDVPEWSTVEELYLEAAESILSRHVQGVAQLLAKAPSLRALVFYSFGGDDLVNALEGRFPRITAIGDRSWMPEKKLAAFPGLRLFATSVHWYPPETALEHGSRIGLDVLVLFGVQDLAGALRALESARVPEARFVVGGRASFLTQTHEHWCVRARRGDPHVDLVWGGGRYEAGDLKKMLDILAKAGKTEIVVTLPRTNTAAAQREAEAFRRATVRMDGRPIALFKL